MMLYLCFLLITPGPVERAVRLANESGRVLLLNAPNIEAVRSVPPGRPPVLSFRYMEGSRKRRFGDTDLVVDDAGH